jgi:ribosomal protein S18 acetylase RimI-like enzyme
MTPQGQVEAGSEEDSQAIHSISERTTIFSAEEIACVSGLWEDYLRDGPGTSGYYFMVYREENLTLGFACVGPRTLAHGVYDLYWLATDPDFRGRGIGRALMANVEGIVRSFKGHLLVIETSSQPAYAPTRAFYRSMGYEIEDTLRDGYGRGDDLVIFTKHFHDDDQAER